MFQRDLTFYKSENKKCTDSLPDTDESLNGYQLHSSYPVTLTQQRVWLLWKLEPEIPYCTYQSTACFDGNIDPFRLTEALKIAANKNDFTRAKFTETEGGLQQTFENSFGEIPLEDLSYMPADVQSSLQEDIARAMVSKLTNITDRTFRIHVFKLSESSYSILFTWHEIIADESSVDLLIKETAQVYSALAQGITPHPGIKEMHSVPEVIEHSR